MREDPPAFVEETVYSTIPLALRRAEQQLAKELGKVEDYDTMIREDRKDSVEDEIQEPTMVKVSWHGGGKTAFLARALDDNWKGRQPMEREYVHFYIVPYSS
jgi:replication-associated recombination protein RarA